VKFFKVDEALQLLEHQALVKYPQSSVLWLKRLNIFIDLEREHDFVIKTFNDALNSVKEKV
jgi:hypothetical protein